MGVDLGTDELAGAHDAVVIAVGSRVERRLEVPGADLDGVHFAMDYLYQRNRAVARADGREAPEPEHEITAAGKRVVVIGGGDTGMDCLSSANREGAASVTMLDVYGDGAGGRALPGHPVAGGAAAHLDHLRAGRGRREAVLHAGDRDRGRGGAWRACTAAG